MKLVPQNLTEADMRLFAVDVRAGLCRSSGGVLEAE
jgi:hypothetical protein